MRQWADALLAILLAPTCCACGQPLLHPTRGCVCPQCWNEIQVVESPLCRQCGDHISLPPELLTPLCSHCIGRRLEVTCSRAVGPHTGSLRAIVHALKYDGHRSVASRLGSLMQRAGADVLRDCDAAVPVPLHPARRRARGFNQAEDLARHVGLPVVHALTRIRHTTTQTELPAAERLRNVVGAFAATAHAGSLRGATVVLIDDVRTTGATLEACATTLKTCGVGEVRALTAARVASPDW